MSNSCPPGTDRITHLLSRVYKLTNTYRQSYPEWRHGQCAFNALYAIDAGLANQIRGGENDPFHNDDRVYDMYNQITLILKERNNEI